MMHSRLVLYIIVLFALPFVLHSLLHAQLRLSCADISPTKNVTCGSYYIKYQPQMHYSPHEAIDKNISCPKSMQVGQYMGQANATIVLGAYDRPINVTLVTCSQHDNHDMTQQFVGCFDASHMGDGMPVYVSSFTFLSWIVYHSFAPIHTVIYAFVVITLLGALLSTRV